MHYIFCVWIWWFLICRDDLSCSGALSLLVPSSLVVWMIFSNLKLFSTYLPSASHYPHIRALREQNQPKLNLFPEPSPFNAPKELTGNPFPSLSKAVNMQNRFSCKTPAKMFREINMARNNHVQQILCKGQNNTNFFGGKRLHESHLRSQPFLTAKWSALKNKSKHRKQIPHSSF